MLRVIQGLPGVLQWPVSQAVPAVSCSVSLLQGEVANPMSVDGAQYVPLH